MNLAETLAREIHRVTVMQCNLEAIERPDGKSLVQISTAPLRLMIRDALEEAFRAAGSGDVRNMIVSVATLKGFEE